ncbi:MAG: AAA family ATPase [Lachnospiraceae bacterium]|nr:AAA family ATPase [Lachnospiraceae bacterium]
MALFGGDPSRKTRIAGGPAESEKRFKEWLRSQVQDDGMRYYTDTETNSYCYALRVGGARVKGDEGGNLFYCQNALQLADTVEILRSLSEFENVDNEGHGTLSTAIELYRYLLERGEVPLPEAYRIHAPFYMSADAELSETQAAETEKFYFEEYEMKPIQRVYYGAPGTGKSYRVNRLLEEEYPDPEERDAHCKRVIFHPSYTYGEFVGEIKQVTAAEHLTAHIYIAGPFTILLKAAFLNPKEKFFLVIEEINRGNAPAIFGDIFQLLDRGPAGKSSYEVVNPDIGAYFSKDPWMKNIFHTGRIWLPSNFSIIATMNTADDNIFVMDSAFKRRFALSYVPINFDILPESMTREYETFSGSRPLKEVLCVGMDNAVSRLAEKLDREQKLIRNWPTFARLANCAIDEENREARRDHRSEEARIAENKKFGPFFGTEEDLQDRVAFLNKVIFYLKQDVFASSARRMLDSYEELYEKYTRPGADIFELLL